MWRPDEGGHHPGAEAEARWLVDLEATASFVVPRVVGVEEPWLVTESPSGLPADRPDRHAEPGALAGAIGAGLAAMHALAPETSAPPWVDASRAIDEPWAPLIERCGRAVAAGRVDTAALPPPYDRYRPERLLELLEAGGSGPGPSLDGGSGHDGPVMCHGRPTLDRFVIDRGRFVGFDGFGEVVVADRHLDLAIAHLGVAGVLGAEAVFAFYEGYGADPDLARLDRAVLAAHLLGAGPTGRP